MVDPLGGGYREKYRRAVAEQERMESLFKFQLDALRKIINHLSIAAQGLDEPLDAALILLKEKMRGASGQQVLEQIEQVQIATAHFARSRQDTGAQSAGQIGRIVEQLAALRIPTQLKRNLSSFKRGLEKKLEAQRNYPAVLEELCKLQQHALDAAGSPPSSFWQRLRGGKTLGAETEKSTARVVESDAVSVAADQVDEHREFEEVADLSPREGELIKVGDEATSFHPGDEETYHQVAHRIARTLDNLVSKIEPNEIVRHKIDIVRLRIQRGMDWYSLAVTLEDIRDILLLRYLQNDREFSDYLQRVNRELHAISEALGLVSIQDLEQRKISDKLSHAVSSQVTAMRNNMEKSGTLDELKLAVTNHLASIQDALSDYRADQSASESITDQLRSLISRVEDIEHESEKTKQLLEEERHRATHDPLTQLPNREAYNERAFHELQRFKRYCRPLTLAVCDIDHFKNINDTYGHQAGDKVLKLIAKLISTRLRKVDFVARYGGEEFVILMPETTTGQAVIVLDKIRAVVGKTAFKFKGSPVTITMSFGVAGFSAEDSVEAVFERADKALYQAKDQGRNRCVIAPEIAGEV